MTMVTRDTLFSAAIHGLVWRADHSWTPAAEATMYFGFTAPEPGMVALERDYYAESNGIQVDLYAATWSGGTLAHTINRVLAKRNDPPPVAIYHGVTPGALTERVTGFAQSLQGGGSRIGLRGDLQPFVHEPGQPYVLAIKNTGNSAAPFSFALGYRLKFPGEDK